MPTYSYKCNECDAQFDVFQRMSEDPIQECKECKGSSVKRLIGAGAGFIFKGSGFYITDYRSKDYKEKSQAESSAGKPETKSNSETKNSSDSSKKTSTSDKKTA